MPRIPEETIQEILAAIDIVDVVGGYIPLKRAGTAYKALCPFHTEKTPSFTVNPARNTFHCFGCGAGGTAIRFVMDYENLPFGEAVRKLADRAGVTIREEEYSAEEESKRALRSRLIQAHQAAAEWFHDLLLNSPAAKGARDYLRGRGIGGEIARRWMIGYAPDDTDLYREWAESNGYSPKLLVAGGLLALRDENNPSRGTYPKFRDRVMFPVKNDYGDYIAFSGRALRPDVPAKYMNSPESPIFNKSKTFFGLDRTKRAILKARCAIICEGQIDLVMCVEAGVENMVAPLGTAFTPDHAYSMKRHTDEVVLCYDSDTAGQAAVEKAYALLAKAGISVRVAEIPEGEDPDSFLRAHGAEAFRALVENAREFFDYLIAAGARKADLTSIAAKTQFSQKLVRHAR
ncbi:MAG: DNA primase [Verrucomicrobiales bacterium]